MANCAPLGGRSTESTVSWAEAQTAPASAITATIDTTTRRSISIFFISVRVFCFGRSYENNPQYLRRRKPSPGYLALRLPQAKVMSMVTEMGSPCLEPQWVANGAEGCN